jgi:hypothetical protein
MPRSHDEAVRVHESLAGFVERTSRQLLLRGAPAFWGVALPSGIHALACAHNKLARIPARPPQRADPPGPHRGKKGIEEQKRRHPPAGSLPQAQEGISQSAPQSKQGLVSPSPGPAGTAHRADGGALALREALGYGSHKRHSGIANPRSFFAQGRHRDAFIDYGHPSLLSQSASLFARLLPRSGYFPLYEQR